MKRIFFLILGTVCLASCTYHGQINPHNNFKNTHSKIIPVSVLLRTDTAFPKEFLITEADNKGTQAFVLDIQDRVLIDITNALGTLFQTVDAGKGSLQNQYDYVAIASLEASLTRTHCEGELAKWAMAHEGLCTLLKISFYHPGKEEPFWTVSATRWREFRTPGFASSVRWFNQHTYIFSPVLTPIYMQSQGHKLRRQFENNLTEILQDILTQIESKHTRFVQENRSFKDTNVQNYVE